MFTLGVCEPYKLEGESCSIFGKENGYCECNEHMGYSCQATESDQIYPAELEPHTCIRSLAGSKK